MVDGEAQCNLEGSAIAAAAEPDKQFDKDNGLTTFLKDRYEQLKTENSTLQSQINEMRKGQGLLHYNELYSSIHDLKVATIKQFINKSHVELDLE